MIILKPCRRYESLAGFRECHIQPDWLLVYDKEDNGELHILNLVRTGTHSDLFKK